MATQATVLRFALRKMGEKDSAGVDETKPYVKRVLNAWDDVVLAAFEMRDWRFASTVSELTQVTAKDGWTYAYNEPSTCLRPLKVRDDTRFDDGIDDIDYEYRAGEFLTDTATCYLRFVDKTYVTDIGSWSQSFANMVGAMLAQECAGPTHDARTVREDIGSAVIRWTKRAMSHDARTDPVYRSPVGSFARARYKSLSSDRGYR